jgi:hypothetical protein
MTDPRGGNARRHGDPPACERTPSGGPSGGLARARARVDRVTSWHVPVEPPPTGCHRQSQTSPWRAPRRGPGAEVIRCELSAAWLNQRHDDVAGCSGVRAEPAGDRYRAVASGSQEGRVGQGLIDFVAAVAVAAAIADHHGIVVETGQRREEADRPRAVGAASVGSAAAESCHATLVP